MTTESTFRAMAIANIAVCLPIGLYYRIKSQATGERLARREEGVLIMVGLRLRGVLAWALFAAYLMNLAWVSWSSLALPAWLRWAGATLGLLVVPPLLFWTFHSLGKNLTDTVVTRREHTLVTHGPYRWVRHPILDAGNLSPGPGEGCDDERDAGAGVARGGGHRGGRDAGRGAGGGGGRRPTPRPDPATRRRWSRGGRERSASMRSWRTLSRRRR
jgi:isoprenylcysteine carboxyl methyltransferase (ICMT) family protein YpbQ